MRIFFTLILLLVCSASFATPQLLICSSSCSKRELVKISVTTWDEVVAIFNQPVNSDKEERSRIAKALQCIELELIEKLVPQLGQEGDYERISETFSNRDETFNTRKALVLFQQHGFIQHHFIRNSQKRSVWIGNDESAMALQSMRNSEIYVVDPTSTAYGQEPLITSYKQWKDQKSIKRIPSELKRLFNESETSGIEQDVFE